MVLELRQSVGDWIGIVVERNASGVHCRELGSRVERGQLSADVRPQSARPHLSTTVNEAAVYPAGRLIQLIQ